MADSMMATAVAMSSRVKDGGNPGKILDFAESVMAMLRRHGRVQPGDRPKGGDRFDRFLPGLTDWQMTQMVGDVDNPSLSYLDELRAIYPLTTESNVNDFISTGRLLLVRTGRVIDSGLRRLNRYERWDGVEFIAKRATVWHALDRPIAPPPKPRSRFELEAEIAVLKIQLENCTCHD